MADKKIFLVFGATGNQGGSIINAILADPKTANEFKIRGITRDPSKPNAKALEARGVECVAADIDNKDQLRSAFQGAYAVFAMTNYWEKMDAELEMRQGRNIADLAKESGIRHLIWSSLLNVTKLTNGKFPGVEHFDSKAEVEGYIREIGVPATFFMPAFFMSNFPGGMLRQLPPDNDWTLALPMHPETPIPLIDIASDTGKFVKGILTHRDSLLGKQVYAGEAYYTPTQIVATFAELYPEAGKKAKFVDLPKEAYKSALTQTGMPEKGAEELAQNMGFMYEFGYFGKASLDESQAILDEKLTTLKEFFSKAKAFEGVK